MDVTFDSTALALERAAVALSPSEAHGILTGLVCAGIREDAAVLAALGGSDDDSELQEVALATCAELAARLDEGDFTFMPLLPDETVPAVQRSRAVVDWCRGFTSGFASPGEPTARTPLADEALSDIHELAQAGGTVNEDDLTEIVEYLRVGVQLLYDEGRGGVRDA